MPIKKVIQNPLTISQPSLSDRIKTQEAFYVSQPLPTLRNKQGNRISSSHPRNHQASFTTVNKKNKKRRLWQMMLPYWTLLRRSLR